MQRTYKVSVTLSAEEGMYTPESLAEEVKAAIEPLGDVIAIGAKQLTREALEAGSIG